jgi:hypothetical protein
MPSIKGEIVLSKLIALAIGIVLSLILVIFGHPWIALVALVGPVLAVVLSVAGISGAVILSTLSGGGTIPIVAGVGFIVTIALTIYSFFV